MATMINMPRLSPTMEEGVLAKWTKKVGDKISPGDIIAEVETDKANMDFPLEDEGVLLKLLVPEGATVKLGDPVAVLGEAGENPDAVTAKPETAAKPEAAAAKPEAPVKPATAAKPEAAAATPEAPEPVAAPTPTVAVAPEPTNGERIKASPFARKLAREQGIDLHAVAGSGPSGRIVARDLDGAKPALVKPAVAKPAIAPKRLTDELTAPSLMRKTIAKRLVEAKQQIPHIYLTADARVDALVALRQEINGVAERKITMNDLVVRALAVALRRVPEANVSWTAEGILRRAAVDIGVAVSLPDGLITPVIRRADEGTIGALSAQIHALAERAKERKLKPEEFSGGSATVSNLGMFGIREFVAIINPPESCILAVGRTEKRAIVVDQDGEDEVVIARQMTLTLSCDHRVVDGVLGAKLLGEVVRALEQPVALLL